MSFRGPGRRLGRDFGWLLSANAVSTVGDGIRLAAGPLLVSTLTGDPALVGGAVFVAQLPWLLLSLPVGVLVDRVDRRRLVVVVAVLRALLAGSLAVGLAVGAVDVAALYAVLFAVGAAEVVADTASSALLPTLVSSDGLPRANARLAATLVVGNQFTGPPLGAWLFVTGAALPFGVEAAGFAGAALLLTRISSRPGAVQVEHRDRGWVRRDVTEGLRWVRREPAVRLLAVVLGVLNVTFMAAFAVWVLYARDRLGLSGSGFGLLLTAGAVGGLTGAALTGRLTDWFGPATLLRVGLLVETATHVVLAVTRDRWVAGAVMAVFGAHAAIWGVVVDTTRQRLVPTRLLGRVTSASSLLTMGGAAVGALTGGFLARSLGLTAPFWIAAAVNTVLIFAVWRRLATVLRRAPSTSPTAEPTADPDDPRPPPHPRSPTTVGAGSWAVAAERDRPGGRGGQAGPVEQGYGMSAEVTIRDAVRADAAAIARVRVAAYRAGFAGIVEDLVLAGLDPAVDTVGWLAGWDSSGETRRVAEIAGTVVGFTVTSRYRAGDHDPPLAVDGAEGELQALHVDPAWWSRGIGSKLLIDALAVLTGGGYEVVRLSVLQANDRARALYHRHGFTDDAIVSPYLPAGATHPVQELRYSRTLRAG